MQTNDARSPPSDTFLMSELSKQVIDVNINICDRIRCFLCGSTGHDGHNCPQKKVEGAGDGAAEGEKKDAVPDPVRLEDEGYPTAQEDKDEINND